MSERKVERPPAALARGTVDGVGVPTLLGQARNVGSAFGHKLVGMLSSMVAVALLAREYGLDGLAIMILAAQVAGYAQLAELGIPSALSRRLPRSIADGDDAAIEQICNTCLATLTAGALVLLALAPLLVLGLPSVFVLTEDQRSVAAILFGITVTVTAIQLPLRMGYGVLSSLHRFSTYFNIELLAILVKTMIGATLLIFADPSMPLYLGLTSIPLLVAAFIEYRVSRAALPHWHTRLLEVRGRWLRELLSLSGAVMVGTLATALTLQGSTLVLASLVSPGQVALYAVPVVLAFNLMSFASSVSAFLSPLASQLSGRDDERLRAGVSLSARYAFAFAALTWLGALLLGPLVLTLWLGAQTLSLASLTTMYVVLVAASGGMALAVPGTMSRGALVATGRHWQVARVELATAALGLAAAVGLTLADVGSPVVCFAASLLVTLVVRGALLLRIAVIAGLLRARTMVRDWLRVVGVVAIGLGAMAATDVAIPAATALHEAIRAIVALTCASVACWFLVVTAQHRRVLLSQLKLASYP